MTGCDAVSDILFVLRVQVLDLPKQHIVELLSVCHSILFSDSEDHGMIAQRVLFDIHKAYKPSLEEQSGPFFEWLKQVRGCSFLISAHSFVVSLLRLVLLLQLYERLPTTYSVQLENTVTSSVALTPANASFKLASEVALMIVFLWQCYPKRLQQYASSLLPLMVQVRDAFITLPLRCE